MSSVGSGPAEPEGADPSPAGDLAALESLYHEALGVPLAARAEWVAACLGHDPAQASLLLRMLAHADDETTGIAKAIQGLVRDGSEPRDRSGERIGRYRLIERLRYGGMAEIYRAARDDGEFEHEVALKLARSDLASADLSALFAAERALLAQLKHPHIIEIFDGGTTPTGEAWFVMSLLDGLPLLAALQQHGLGSDEVFGHLIDLCAAVSHAHGQLIVHRDIKPENILLCRAGHGLSVRLLDFGIAAQLAGGLGAEAAQSDEASRGAWHSPGYAAPETRAGKASGAAADIYALGRVLLDCVEHVAPRFRAELRAIGDKACSEAPGERYPSASSLAEDLERLRRREPISLFRHRRLHVFSRAMERHRWAVLAAVLTLAAGSAWLWRESGLRIAAEQATARAQAERDRAEAMRDFLLDVFRSGNPRLNRGEDPRVSDLIDGQLDRLQAAANLDPDAHYELLSTFADLLLHLGQRDLAERAYAQAVTLTESQGESGGLRWAAMVTRRGQIASHGARFDEADRWFGQAEQALDSWPPSVERAQVASVLYSSWGASAQRRGNLDEAERLIRRGLEAKPILKAANLPGGDDAAMRVTLGAIQTARDDLPGALETFRTAYDDHRAAGRSDTLEHLALLGWLGITADRLGRPAEAEPYLIEAVALAEKLFPEPHSKLSGSYANLGRLYLNQGRLSDAEPLLRRALEVSESAGEANTPDHALRLQALGLLDLESERFEDAIARFEQASALSEATVGPTHRRTLTARLSLVSARAELPGDTRLLGEVETLLAAIGPAPFRPEALLLAARLAARNGDRARAQAKLDEAETVWAKADPAAPETPHRFWLRARARAALDQHDAAREDFLAAVSAYQSSGREDHPGRGRALLQAALTHPAGSAERVRLGEQARRILLGSLRPPAASLAALDGL